MCQARSTNLAHTALFVCVDGGHAAYGKRSCPERDQQRQQGNQNIGQREQD